MKELENDSIVPVPTGIDGAGGYHPAEPRIEKVFFDLCAEHPGAAAIRDSYAQFKKLKRWDHEQEEKMRRLAPRPSFGLADRLLSYLWRMIPTWREEKPLSPPLPSWSSDTDLQNLETETPIPRQNTHTNSAKSDLATTNKV